MRKRLGLIFCLIMTSILGFVGCSSDPYASMRIESVDEIVGVQKLSITQDYDGSGVSYKYDTIDFKVKVSGVGEGVSDRVDVSGGNGGIAEPVVTYLGNGVSQITATLLEVDKITRDDISLIVRTIEGGKSLKVDFHIDIELSNFRFDDSKLKAVTSDYSIVLDDIDGLIVKTPKESNHVDFEYSIVSPSATTDEIDEWGDSPTFTVDDSFYDYLALGYKYADVVSVAGKSTLVVYPYFRTSTGEIALDYDNKPIPTIFPQVATDTVGTSSANVYEYITLKAHSISGKNLADRYLNVRVVPNPGDVVLEMNSDKDNSDRFAINADKDGIFNVILLNANSKGSILLDDNSAYFYERTLFFSVKNPIMENEILEQYRVVNKIDSNEIVSIRPINPSDNVFKIEAEDVGDKVHTFVMENTDYPDLFSREVKVRFKVLDIPTATSVQIDAGDPTTVYNVYPSNTYGTKVSINTNSNFSYNIAIDSSDKDVLGSALIVRRSGDGEACVMGSLDRDSETLSSIDGLKKMTSFSSKSTFYLKYNNKAGVLPKDQTYTIYIIISYTIADESYAQDIKDEYFGKQNLMCFPIHLVFEEGVESVAPIKENYNINLSNSAYLYEEDASGEVVNPLDGFKLLDLPAGRSYEDTIASVSYDTSFIKVYHYLDGDTNIVSLYVKYLADAKADQTTSIVISAYNGMVGRALVKTYVPTIYNVETLEDMPLACDVNEYSSAFLYYMTGKDVDNHKALYQLSKDNTEIPDAQYTSIKTLFLIVNQTQIINFYDYRLIEENGSYIAEAVNITDKVQVSFLGAGTEYASYSNGVIYTHGLVTTNYLLPVQMVVTYDTGYEDFDMEGNSIFTPVTITYIVNLYIYEPLEGVEIISSKEVGLYIYDSLGYYNKDLSQDTIISTFIPNKVELGAQWNNNALWGSGEGWEPVELSYEYRSALNSPILGSSKQEMKIKTRVPGGADHLLLYRDLFEVTETPSEYQCSVKCVMSDDLKDWFANNGYTTDEQVDYVLKQIFNENIELVVYVNIQQFNKLVNINSVRFTAQYAERIGELKLDLDDDGAYFEIRDGQISHSLEISYTINNASVVNKNIMLFDDLLTFYNKEVKPNATGNGGKIIITPIKAGSGQLVVTPQDNIKDKDNTYYNDSSTLVQSFRIKIADGSEDYPFEIRSIEDYQQMILDIQQGHYYHYIITRDLYLSGYNVNNINIIDNVGKSFYLTGKHTYNRNGETITRYSTIFDLSIEQNVVNVSGDIGVGLFGKLGNFVTLDNISISNARITLIDNAEGNNTISIGILAGMSDATINACCVSGTIKIIRNNSSATQRNIVVGGMVGTLGQASSLENLPGSYESGIIASGNSAFVDIELTTGKDSSGAIKSNSQISRNILGGLVGKTLGADISNVQVIANITSELRSTIGGVVGLVAGTGRTNELSNVYAVPSIVATFNSNTSDRTNALDIGGVIGRVENTYTLLNVVVNYLSVETSIAEQRTNIWVTASANNEVNVGGLIGREGTSGSISKSYVRSFNELEISTDNYYGSIFAFADCGRVGGLVGLASNNSVINKSYFDADIVTSGNLTVGMLTGDVNLAQTYKIQYSYAIGNLYLATIVDNKYSLQAVSDIGNFGIIGSANDTYSSMGEDIFGEGVAVGYEYAGLNTNDVYAVVNGNINYFMKGKIIYAINNHDADGHPVALPQNVVTLFKKLGYRITEGSDENLDEFDWFWYDAINTVKVGETTLAYPVLFVDGIVMYDLLPTSINVVINERAGLYNITYEDIPQVIMYLNRYVIGSNDKTYYELALNKDTASFDVKLNGTNISTTYIQSNKLKLYDKIEILEDSQENVLRISGNKIYPVNTGTAVITIRSYAVHSVKVTIKVLVLDGLTDVNIDNMYEAEDGDLTGIEPEENVIYIDEQSKIVLSAINKNETYVANSNYGFVLELLDADNNATIKINNKEYTYDSENLRNNILVFSSRDVQITGVKLGNIKWVMTPFLMLNDVNYLDTYTSYANEEISIQKQNVYFLNKGVATIQKLYDVKVIARASHISNSTSSIGLNTALGGVAFSTTIQTANVSITNNGDGTYSITIYEDLKLSINNKAWEDSLKLSNVTFKCTMVGNKFVCVDSDFATSMADNVSFKYSLVNILFKNMSIAKINPVALKENTYNLTLSGTVLFDRAEYRANADKYDISSANFDVEMSPSSNLDINAKTKITIAPSELKSIFTNFYSRINRSDSIYNEYPEDNESEFIVPGRDGLLKISLDKEINDGEFNNSSYIIIKLDKKYEGLVTLQQLSAIVDAPLGDGNETGDIVGYRNVISSETVSGNNYFGIKLSKLSINYSDTNYFNNTYYIKISLRTSITESSLDMDISSYTRNGSSYSEQLTESFSLAIMELPYISATIDGEAQSVMGRGVKKELDIAFRGISENIDYDITATSPENQVLNASQYVYITDQNDNEVVQLDIDYLSSGKKYYLNQDVSTPSGTKFNIVFTARETILGILEESNCVLAFTTVDFEVDSATICGVGNNGTLNLKFGENIGLDVKIDFKKIEIGDSADIEEYTSNELKELLTIAGYEFSGTKLTTYENGIEQVKSSGKINLWIRDNSITSHALYTPITGEGSYGGITLIKDIRKLDNGVLEYYELLGSEISNDTYMQLDVKYYFDNNGQMHVGENISSAVYSDGCTLNFTIVVEDNSTYDHPTPVEDSYKLESISGVEGGNFILVNNIELENWKPQEGKFATLDGNGYTITIKSFDLSDYRGVSSADVGIFSTLSENSLLKNIIIDISPLLVSEQTMRNNDNIMRASSKNTYKYGNGKIDLGYIETLNFGIIAGTNNGSITNAKVVSTVSANSSSISEQLTSAYLHVLTTQGSVDGKEIVSNIGGLVGVNSGTGAITNSFIGVNISNSETVTSGSSTTTKYYIETVTQPSVTKLDNKTDDLAKVEVYPFVLAGGNILGGLVAINDGVISSSYAKGLGVYNSNSTVGGSATAGLVTYNNNIVTSSFVEGHDIKNFRAVDNRFKLESTGNIGGLVYQNNKTIENCYANAYIQNNSSYLGGFVYQNNQGGYINNCYSTAVNGNSHAIGQFTGVKQGVLQNNGVYQNCYYLILDNDELASPIEDAVEIVNSSNPFDSFTSWSGFSFVTGANADGIWTLNEGETPKIASTLTDTISFRQIINSAEGDAGIVYDYIYNTYYLGSKENPLIIEKAENFDKYIIDNTFSYDNNGSQKMIFGYREGENATRYVRLVNNLDFENVVFANGYKNTNLYMITFAGVLDGNGMSLSNLNLNTKIDSRALDNFGLFGEIGYQDASAKAVIKNLNLGVKSFSAKGNNKTGILAGTIVNSSIVNIKIDGGSTISEDNVVSGFNMAGALAGLIYADQTSNVSIIDVEVSNVRVSSSYTGISGTLSKPKGYFYDEFVVIKNGQTSTNGFRFNSLYESGETKLANISQVSYAGGVAGAVIANNYTTELKSSATFEDYRTKSNESTISNVTVNGQLVVNSEYNAGGLFGYVGENTLIRNSSLIVSDGQLLKGGNFVGGIVGENHGTIEQCTVSYTTDVSVEINQSVYDSTILSNDRDNGTFNLFDMSTGIDYYTVAIGGIAGYSEDGIILDSYSKVNVVKSLSFIAGGIVGYAKGYNYLGFVYNTGAVYGRDIIGGIIGLQVSDASREGNNIEIGDKTYMHNVVSLTNWNATNIRDEVTLRLHNNQSIIYKNETDARFYIKMPEVGNAPIVGESGDSQKNERENAYWIATKSGYIGSVIGQALLSGGSDPIMGTLGTDNPSVSLIFNNTDNLLNDLYSGSTGILSSTLGIVYTTGDIASGNRIDDYFKESFRVENGEDEGIDSLSYRTAYPTELNNYVLGEEGVQYLDEFTFAQIFTSQEYIQQLLGVSYSSNGDESEGIGSTLSTRNIFAFGFSNERFNINANNTEGKFVDANAGIWEVSNDTEEDYFYLPKYADGVVRSRVEVYNANELEKAFGNSSTGKTYVIKNNITWNLDGNGTVKYYAGVKSLFVGQVTNNIKPKITINADKLATIFNLLNGAVFQDVDFEINVKSAQVDSNANIDGNNFGLFANTLDGVQIVNCDFKINIEQNIVSFSTSQNFSPTNIGVLFGAINNSTIRNSKFDVAVTESNLRKDISNFGLLAGSISRSSFDNVEIALSSAKVNIYTTSASVGVGGIAGTVYNSKFVNTDLNKDLEIEVVDSSISNKSIAGLFGSANQLNLNSISNVASLKYSMSSVDIDNLNLALVVGESTASKISNVIISNDVELQASGTAGKTIKYYNIGSVIGKDIKNSQIGKSGVVGSYATLNSTINAYQLNAGGLVGYTGESYWLINNAFVDGSIKITNTNKNALQKIVTNEKGESTITYLCGCTYVGGLLGYAEGRVALNSVVSGVNIVVNIAEDKSTESKGASQILASVGGLIGAVKSTTIINEFASIGEITLNKLDYDTKLYPTYISGVLGYNDGVLVASNGYSYVQLPRGEDITTICLSIANGVVSSANNVYYTQEFVGNSYHIDILFGSFAMADIYYVANDVSNHYISSYSSIYALNDNDVMMQIEKIGDMGLYIPSSLAGRNYFKRTGSSDKFHPNKITSLSNSTINTQYNVIINSISQCTVGNKVSKNCIVSGRSISTGKVVLGLNSVNTNTIKYLFAENNGTLSNVYICVTGNNTSAINKYSLVQTNNGYITNVMVYGITSANYAIAETNNGYIYSSVSSIKYSPVVDSDNKTTPLYGLVNVNKGVISDCYSSSFAYVDDGVIVQTSVYGFANKNEGIIQYSSYYVEPSMLHDNKVEGGVSTGDGVMQVCFNEQTPSVLLARKNIWKEENGHVQIVGMKDIDDSIITKIFITINGKTTYIQDVAVLKNYITTAVNEKKDYTLSYEYAFYQATAVDRPTYRVVRISLGEELEDYIASLNNGYIPANTVVLITNNFAQEDSHVLKVVATKLNRISLSSSTSALIGINTKTTTGGNTPNMILDFSTGKDGVYGVMTHELFNENKGLIIGIDICNISFTQSSAGSWFAPIYANYGIISHVNFYNYSVLAAMGTPHVSCMVYDSSMGIIHKSGVNEISVTAGKLFNFICYKVPKNFKTDGMREKWMVSQPANSFVSAGEVNSAGL